MGRFNAILFLVFALGLMSSASMAKAPSLAQAPVAAAPKLSPIETPAEAPPASAPSEVAKTPSSASSPTAQAHAFSPSAAGPGPALPTSSGATATTSLENIMAIIGVALIGGAAFIL